MHRRLDCVLTGLALLVACTSACEKTMTVAGTAMEPTLKNGERVVTALAVGSHARGDVVAMKSPLDHSKFFVLRVVALPGERIGMTNGRVMIDGRPLVENYVDETNRSLDTWGPITIPKGEYFVMGDNRRNSFDSRSWGTIGWDAIIAKIVDR